MPRPIIQRPEDLMLAVVEYDLSAGFTVFKQQEIRYEDVAVQFAIIGESHIITVLRDEQVVLQEILACVTFPPEIQAHRFDDLGEYTENRHHYGVHVRFATGEADIAPLGKDAIEYEFPTILGQSPLTRINWSCSGRIIQWWTLHRYITEQSSIDVRTQSNFALN